MIVPSRSRNAARRAVTLVSRERRAHGPHELVVIRFGNAAQVEQETTVADASDDGVRSETQSALDVVRRFRERDGERWKARRRERTATNARFRLHDIALDATSEQALAYLLRARTHGRDRGRQHGERRNFVHRPPCITV